jgi:hypothetical protein
MARLVHESKIPGGCIFQFGEGLHNVKIWFLWFGWESQKSMQGILRFGRGSQRAFFWLSRFDVWSRGQSVGFCNFEAESQNRMKDACGAKNNGKMVMARFFFSKKKNEAQKWWIDFAIRSRIAKWQRMRGRLQNASNTPAGSILRFGGESQIMGDRFCDPGQNRKMAVDAWGGRRAGRKRERKIFCDAKTNRKLEETLFCDSRPNRKMQINAWHGWCSKFPVDAFSNSGKGCKM